jgi:thiamine biosynthesis lipoprotein
MRFVETAAIVLIAWACLHGGDGQVFVHAQRYTMGTMFDVAAYHSSAPQAERAIDRALAEVVRLDHVMSHFEPDSDLSKLVQEGRTASKSVDPALYDVLGQAVDLSRRSGGSFDVTIGALVRTWQAAQTAGRAPGPEAIADAKRCVGYSKLQLTPPDLVRIDSNCLLIDLGAIGKGYAVERAIRILQEAGIRDAVVNAGQSSIAAIGHQPERAGWLVDLGVRATEAGEIELRDSSISTSRQARIPLLRGDNGYGNIIDPARGRPVASSMTVIVRMASATHADALSTTLLLMPIEQGKRLLDTFPGAAALWLSDTGRILASHGQVR